MRSKRTKALDISAKVRRAVQERDGGCVLCGRAGCQLAHVVSRAQGGLGQETNLVLVCPECHRELDQSTERGTLMERVQDYLRGVYPEWSARAQEYRKYSWEV